MSAGRALQPWAHRSGSYALPNSLLVRLALGEAPEGIPAALDIRSGAAACAEKTGIGSLDRIVASFGGAVRVSRVHAARATLGRAGCRHMGFDDVEQTTGVARLFRFDVAPGTHIGSLAISLLQLNMVEAATPNYLCIVGLEAPFGRLKADGTPCTAREQIEAAAALALEPGDPAVIVAVIDSGLALSHPEFGGRARAGFDTVRLGEDELAAGVELIGDRRRADTNPLDKHVGHGTGCAGIIAGRGIEMPPGLAGASQFVPIRSLGAAKFPGRDQAVGIGAIGDLDMGLKMAVDLGARVINMSFGTDDDALEPGAPKPHEESVRYAARRGCILVAASGNSGDARIYWPAAFSEVITVGAADARGQACRFSTTGPHVALSAPGERILTANIEGYQRATGTSFAAPFVAATAALMMAHAARRSAPLDAATARAALIAGCNPFAADVPPGNGAGVLNAAGALKALDAILDAEAHFEESDDD